MNKASEAILSNLGDCWGKIYLFFALSKTDGRVPSQQGFPTTFFSADVSPGTSGHFWCGHRQNSDL